MTDDLTPPHWGEGMSLDEALAAAMEGARVTAPHLQTGSYVEHTFTRGYLRCFPVDKPEDEPNRSQCDFHADDADRAATWRVFEREEQYPPKPKLVGGWGAMPKAVHNEAVHKALLASSLPVADVIDLSATTPINTSKPAADLQAWAKPLDPRKGGW